MYVSPKLLTNTRIYACNKSITLASHNYCLVTLNDNLWYSGTGNSTRLNIGRISNLHRISNIWFPLIWGTMYVYIMFIVLDMILYYIFLNLFIRNSKVSSNVFSMSLWAWPHGINLIIISCLVSLWQLETLCLDPQE